MAASTPLLDDAKKPAGSDKQRAKLEKAKAANLLVPSNAQVESIRASLSNELAVTVNRTLVDDYRNMTPIVERKKGSDWVRDDQATESWMDLVRNPQQSFSDLRAELAWQLLSAGQSYLYVEGDKSPWIQFISPMLVTSKRTDKGTQVFVRTGEGTKDEVSVDPKRVQSLWTPNPLLSLSGWPGARRQPWTWLMPLQDKFRILGLLDRSLESMAVNRFLHNGILWFESKTDIPRANLMMGVPAVPPSSGPSGVNVMGSQGLPFADSSGHRNMVAAQMPDPFVDSKTYLRVLDKAYREPASAAARSPFPVYWPSKPEFVQPGVEFDAQRREEAKEATIAIARGCPLPFDFVMSSGSDSAHWSRKNMREETIEVSVEFAGTVDAALQTSLFQTWVLASKLNPDEWRISSDASGISVKPDITMAVAEGHKAGIVTDEGFLAASHIPEEFWVPDVKGSGRNVFKTQADAAMKHAEDAAAAQKAEAATKAKAATETKSTPGPVDDAGVVEPKRQRATSVPYPDEETDWY